MKSIQSPSVAIFITNFYRAKRGQWPLPVPPPHVPLQRSTCLGSRLKWGNWTNPYYFQRGQDCPCYKNYTDFFTIRWLASDSQFRNENRRFFHSLVYPKLFYRHFIVPVRGLGEQIMEEVNVLFTSHQIVYAVIGCLLSNVLQKKIYSTNNCCSMIT